MSARLVLIAITAATLPAGLHAQARKPARPAAAPAQKIIAPKTVYWLNAATTSGFGLGAKAPSTGDIMRMAMGGGTSSAPAKSLSLDLGSKLPPSGPPAASHAIPPGMAMGPSLALKTPKPEKAEPYVPDETRQEPEEFQRPKGRILLFWGCGEAARPGQPVIIDFAKLAAGQLPPGLFAGDRVRIAYPPSTRSWPTWGGWPNDDKPSKKGIPAEASLIGAHQVTGNYTPPIDFTLRQDWLQGLAMTQTKAPSGALALAWNAVPGATSHFAQMIGGAQGADGGGDLVFWSSSEVQTFMSGLSDYIAPAEAARLVARKQLLPPAQTSCAIPAPAMAAVQGGLISLVAHGPEENFVQPPRPSDPRTPWVQEWAVKARFVARTGAIAGMDMGAAASGRTSKSGKPKCPPDTASSVGEAVGGAFGSAVGGLFGKKKKNPDCEP